MRRGEIWMVAPDPDPDPVLGREQQGHRPVLIVTEEAFNRVTMTPVVVPITRGGGFAVRQGFAVPLAGTRTEGVVLCHQPRALDPARRSGRRVEAVPEDIVEEVLARLAPLFE
ncbi:type II toxin-antitoxin system PemK/MazF family toxin [soil metagenome]